jgi:hypothetical protein
MPARASASGGSPVTWRPVRDQRVFQLDQRGAEPADLGISRLAPRRLGRGQVDVRRLRLHQFDQRRPLLGAGLQRSPAVK